MDRPNRRFFAASAVFLLLAGLVLADPPVASRAASVTFDGTVSYEGPYAGDLYVAVLDTAGVEDVTLLAVDSFDVGAPPFAQAYSLEFDNAVAGPQVFLVALLDVDGAGLADVSGADVFGWYAGGSTPVTVASAASQNGLDFPLPLAEIRGTITFGPGQTETRVDVSDDTKCAREGLRPQPIFSSPGPYTVVGIYPGTYCVSASGFVPAGGDTRVCFGDPTCVSPMPITLGATEIRTGVDLDFGALVPIQEISLGALKARFR